MYIIELLAKLINKKKEKKVNINTPVHDTCEHVFLPLDSTNDILGCTKCGFIVHRGDIDIKSRNPFSK